LTKDVLANLTLKELLIRIMQMQNFHELKDSAHELAAGNRFANVLEYIKKQPHQQTQYRCPLPHGLHE
jgi:AraC family transcriptional regulator of arabinose operon